MRKIIVLLSLLLSMGVKAQEYWDASRPNHRLTFGLRAGANFSKQYNTGDGADMNFNTGFKAGLEVDLNIVRSFSVNSGFYFVQRGYKSEYSDYRGSMTTTDNASYVELPLLASYRVKLSDAAQFQLNLGPYFAFGVTGKQKIESTFPGLQDYEIDSFDKYDGLKKHDVGIQASAAITYSNYFIGVSYERSIINVSNASDAKFQNGSIGFCLGYNF